MEKTPAPVRLPGVAVKTVRGQAEESGTRYLTATHAPSTSCLACLHPERTGDGWPAVSRWHRGDLGPVRAVCSPLGLKFVKTKRTLDALLGNGGDEVMLEKRAFEEQTCLEDGRNSVSYTKV